MGCFAKTMASEFISEMKEFVQSTVTGIDGRIPVVIGMAARKSYLEHRPVRLSEITVLSSPLVPNLDTLTQYL